MNLILEFHNNLTRAKEPGPAFVCKDWIRPFYYVEQSLSE
ncbi:hypothetical protein LEP1GSC008_3375 [Leptospira kirschneri serovar Bulgarica str. Nikolaevo]|uniref:Uncharacterized protein n=2 Tax=Leptospira kirschneri TaxID=29507 RepID=A0A0E2B2M9_9LEPT|nr:hypothetical protein LEP1GSC081_0004 [Leptospira kirschneri str. H1]EMK24690.1 hypothetical protein LEP1GSC008_3375 [Leptospira kirschneri serovar Bulgarica str. Nikolaevo]